MRWLREEETDNPAWPGLVDVFAFTLVFILLLGFGGGDVEKLRKEIEALKKENARLQKELEDSRRGPWAKIIDKLNEIYPILKNRLDRNFIVNLNEKDLEIIIKGDPSISFESAEYELEKDRDRISHLSSVLFETLREQPFYILINGTADPQEMRDRGIPPHDNIQLSALRAATVAALLEKAAKGLGDFLRIVGLGVKGREVPLPPGVDPKEFYRPYRTVDLVVKVDLEKLLQKPRPSQQRGYKIYAQ